MFFSYLFLQIAEIVVDRPAGLPDVEGEELISGILNLVFIALAGISTIVLVLQGISYSLSGGDVEKTRKARNGIIYALVGVTTALSSWSLFNFAIESVIRDTSTQVDNSTLTNLFADIAGFMIFIAGFISLVVLLTGAIKFVVSGDNSQETKKARDMIIYAIVGLVISVSAGPILALVLTKL